MELQSQNNLKKTLIFIKKSFASLTKNRNDATLIIYKITFRFNIIYNARENMNET